MDTQVATKQIRIREWATIIQDRINSGMTVNAYCAQHGLTMYEKPDGSYPQKI